MRLLVACHSIVATGGLLRFERVGLAARSHGHSLAYVAEDTGAPEFESQFEILTPDEAAQRQWDAVLVPGAGFPTETIQAFSRFGDRRFGVRVQMVLNDQSKRERFVMVNRAFHPDIVVFNSEIWTPGSYREFEGKRFHHLIGAVDTQAFGYRPRNGDRKEHFVLGAQAAKNPKPVIEALGLLPQAVSVKFFGYDRSGMVEQARREHGLRVDNVGPLFGDALPQYYNTIDAMLSTETNVGWANVIAEAMSAGVPVITSAAGAFSLADDTTAVLLGAPSADLIAEAVTSLRDDPGCAHQRVAAARRRVEQYSWDRYSRELVELIEGFDGASHFMFAPERGLFGKTLASERLHGIEPVLQSLAGKTVLDVGAAEGFITEACVRSGARRVLAIELDRDRARFAQAAVPEAKVLQADLADPETISRLSAEEPAGFDVVLYLGVHHHLPAALRPSAARDLARLCRECMAVRTSRAAHEEVASVLKGEGFTVWRVEEQTDASYSGPVVLYRRA